MKFSSLFEWRRENKRIIVVAYVIVFLSIDYRRYRFVGRERHNRGIYSYIFCFPRRRITLSFSMIWWYFLRLWLFYPSVRPSILSCPIKRHDSAMKRPLVWWKQDVLVSLMFMCNYEMEKNFFGRHHRLSGTLWYMTRRVCWPVRTVWKSLVMHDNFFLVHFHCSMCLPWVYEKTREIQGRCKCA